MTGGGTIDEPIGRHRSDRLRMAVREDGRPAITHYRVLERFRAHTYLRVKLETGRTHQIRLHLAHRRYPIVGDPVYGGRFARPRGAGDHLIETLRAFRRQALHAATLAFDQPRTGQRLTLQSPVPQDFARLLDALREDAAGGRVNLEWLKPQWPAPAAVGALSTLRGGGVSLPPYASLNLGTHVGDEPAAVLENRRRLRIAAELPAEPAWLSQVHGAHVLDLDAARTSGGGALGGGASGGEGSRATRTLPLRAAPVASAPFLRPTACRSCLPRIRGRWWVPPMPAGAASPAV